jgi:hypothetical protein
MFLELFWCGANYFLTGLDGHAARPHPQGTIVVTALRRLRSFRTSGVDNRISGATRPSDPPGARFVTLRLEDAAAAHPVSLKDLPS